MNSVERVKAICKERKIPISRLEKDLGFANGYIGQLRKGNLLTGHLQCPKYRRSHSPPAVNAVFRS